VAQWISSSKPADFDLCFQESIVACGSAEPAQSTLQEDCVWEKVPSQRSKPQGYKLLQQRTVWIEIHPSVERIRA